MLEEKLLILVGEWRERTTPVSIALESIHRKEVNLPLANIRDKMEQTNVLISFTESANDICDSQS